MTISLEFQRDWPVFVRSRYNTLTIRGVEYKYNDFFPWKELSVPEESVLMWFKADILYHNSELEKQNKVGDRLSEFDKADLEKIVARLNVLVKQRTNSTNEYNAKKVKQSAIDEKQRGLLRSWLRNNRWAEEEFYTIRDEMLGE